MRPSISIDSNRRKRVVNDPGEWPQTTDLWLRHESQMAAADKNKKQNTKFKKPNEALD